MLKHLWDLSWKPCESISNGNYLYWCYSWCHKHGSCSKRLYLCNANADAFLITLVAWGPFIIFLLMLNNDIVLTVTFIWNVLISNEPLVTFAYQVPLGEFLILFWYAEHYPMKLHISSENYNIKKFSTNYLNKELLNYLHISNWVWKSICIISDWPFFFPSKIWNGNFFSP